ncbi:Single-stranded nucleic acid binding R3H [Cordyceps fumosorosea ARSEF 2679]|uniref:Single-stranded nucleic acid binding R3H n=1 Tax=Cordyceps fumosorosea (strain ARSEF 2679) TaxID=1081104 RepID=A0A168ENI9_CORFA|nr:Single-stranded nucleic acid binding R3H [Cordyceps fumosorosea ARSEF 2679]OAA74027.1 Single-stranded nucleic acid binding R3H [Cordyceps fumosorosea ARSEF 2679]
MRRPECGHPPVEHHCHPEETGCPKCPFLVEKWCACGKEKLHSQPCHIQEARCGKPCGKKLKCGLHFCKKLCHRAGDCEDAALESGQCGQTCGKVKMFCEHRCQNSCHGQTPCNESAACSGKTEIACPCGIRKQEVRCLASSTNTEPARPELKCDDECLRQERNRRLAAALNIDPATHTNDHIPYSEETLALFEETPTWCETQEREFRVFSQSPTEIRIRYKPMPNNQRRFLHVLAEDYGLESRSEDNEPFRYVLVYKGPRFVSAPGKTIAHCVKIRATQQAAAAAAAVEAAAAAKPQMLSETEPLNAFLLTSPRFGLTTDEVGVALAADLSEQPSLHFKIEYLPSDEVLLRATVRYSSLLSATGIETAMRALQKGVAARVRGLDMAGHVSLCHVDAADVITRREDSAAPQNGVGGWSAVAGRAAARKESSATPDASPARVGGRRLLGLRKKRVDQPAERPWASQLDGDVEC